MTEEQLKEWIDNSKSIQFAKVMLKNPNAFVGGMAQILEQIQQLNQRVTELEKQLTTGN